LSIFELAVGGQFPWAPFWAKKKKLATMEAISKSTPEKGKAHSQYQNFEKGVRSIFSNWTALVLAVENGWGGTRIMTEI
jgi:hypothetical protein